MADAKNQSLINISSAVQTILQLLLNTTPCAPLMRTACIFFMPGSHWKLMPPGIDAILELFFSLFKTWACSCCFKCLFPPLHPSKKSDGISCDRSSILEGVEPRGFSFTLHILFCNFKTSIWERMVSHVLLTPGRSWCSPELICIELPDWCILQKFSFLETAASTGIKPHCLCFFKLCYLCSLDVRWLFFLFVFSPIRLYDCCLSREASLMCSAGSSFCIICSSSYLSGISWWFFW